MSVGPMALRDDVAGLAKVAAASVDAVIGRAARARAKAAGVIDGAAVTPRYVVGFAADRDDHRPDRPPSAFPTGRLRRSPSIEPCWPALRRPAP